jgi:hypothetical protein
VKICLKLPVFLILCFTLSLFACTVERRIHRKGFHIEWRRSLRPTDSQPVARASCDETTVQSREIELLESNDTPTCDTTLPFQTAEPGIFAVKIPDPVKPHAGRSSAKLFAPDDEPDEEEIIFRKEKRHFRLRLLSITLLVVLMLTFILLIDMYPVLGIAGFLLTLFIVLPVTILLLRLSRPSDHPGNDKDESSPSDGTKVVPNPSQHKK